MSEPDELQQLMELFKTQLSREEFQIVFSEILRESVSSAYDAGYQEGVKSQPPPPKMSSLIIP